MSHKLCILRFFSVITSVLPAHFKNKKTHNENGWTHRTEVRQFKDKMPAVRISGKRNELQINASHSLADNTY